MPSYLVHRTLAAIDILSQRRDGLAVFAASTFIYALGYLWAIQDLTFRSANLTLIIVEQPLQRMSEPAPGMFSYEPIALIEFGFGTYLFSPFNTSLGIFLATLVGLNISLSYFGIVEQRSCGIGAGTGVLAAFSALITGSACCAPVILIIFGITANATLLAAIPWLLPGSMVLLLVSGVYLAVQIDPNEFLS